MRRLPDWAKAEAKGGACSVDGCSRPKRTRGMCAMHYMRRLKDGSIDRLPKPSLEDRFYSYVDKTDASGCWVWTGQRHTNGYGAIWRGGKALAHRVSYEIHVGPIPEGLTIDHLCRNRLCVNPEHLEAVTIGENVLRSPFSVSGANIRKTHCPQGHEYTEENTARYANRTHTYRSCRACKRAQDRARYAKRKGVASR